MTRTLSLLVFVLVLLAGSCQPAFADPGAGVWTVGPSMSTTRCSRQSIGPASPSCSYEFTDATNSQTFQVVTGASAQVCLLNVGAAVAEIAVREVLGDTFDDAHAPRVDDLVLTGVHAPPGDVRCIRNLPPGVYWVEIVTAPSGTAVVALKAN